jgi:hypothetical protein
MRREGFILVSASTPSGRRYDERRIGHCLATKSPYAIAGATTTILV